MIRRLDVRNVLFAAPVLAALTVVAAVGLSTGAEAAASSTQAVDATAAAAGNYTYYSNGSHTTVVGQFGYDCCNNPVAWGSKTRFVTSGGCFPCFPPPR